MSRYRGYSEDIEVLIAILDELRDIKELLSEKQQEVETPRRKPRKRENDDANGS